MGTPDFAVPSLEALAASDHAVVGVLSQPDRPRGRGRKLAPTPIHAAAECLGLPLLQPDKVGSADAVAWMRAREPDLGCVVAFGQYIGRVVRELPPRGLINAHASLLPRWRGAAPIQHAILAGDTRTGVTIIRVAREMDAGDADGRVETPIGPDETAGELALRLSQLAAQLLVGAVDAIAADRARFEPQPREGVTLAPRVDRDFGRIDWSRPRDEVLRRVRAATPAPGAWTELWPGPRGIRLLRARQALAEPGEAASRPARPGAVSTAGGRLRIAAVDGWIEVHRLQEMGRREQGAGSWLRGARLLRDEEIEAR
ncbi:MAG: methionyl-tRNA formyltransferase [Myxococcota bacterium]